ncbi:type II/IV secretion system protein [Bacillus sp. HMF5848]|uniref:competence type IV pilus ATPase ComGA n=1 Tax=Bacillus sp. HMF5848 TaxID=2495421 RepID=UPI000F78A0EB|nr:competence type IV pilus ATPase ComGA [Bacillus sp. HMF5848]RSK27831.1 type II/IV secretion system protein [Bacillus sp. HMF5848]
MQDIEMLAENLVIEAYLQHASDIHIVPRRNDAEILLRIDDELYFRKRINKKEYDRLLGHFKFSASMDIGETRRPQNGALTVTVKNIPISLRLSTLPTPFHESLVIRLLPQDNLLPPTHISLFPDISKKLLALFKHSHGLIIFTGPTGSGKTTTLYSLLHATKKELNRNIITLEDPIEKQSDDMLQVQINEKAGITYAAGLKAILRHDPDIIMVGEIRDEETAKVAIRAALTGHLVLSTMHTRHAKGSVFRLLELGASLQELEQTLIAVSAQRLVDLKCPYCKGKCTPDCKKARKQRRACIHELLVGQDLGMLFRQLHGECVHYHYKEIPDLIRKGIALGYINPESFEKWAYQHDQKK